jgi:hypothetical protein
MFIRRDEVIAEKENYLLNKQIKYEWRKKEDDSLKKEMKNT